MAIQVVNEKVDILSLSRNGKGIVVPFKMKWHGRMFTITKIGLRHETNNDGKLHHIFSCTDGSHFFRLDFNTYTLQWLLEEFDDGLSS